MKRYQGTFDIFIEHRMSEEDGAVQQRGQARVEKLQQAGGLPPLGAWAVNTWHLLNKRSRRSGAHPTRVSGKTSTRKLDFDKRHSFSISVTFVEGLIVSP